MVICKRVGFIVFFLAFSKFTESADFAIPEVKFEALKTGGFRVSIPEVPGTSRFKFEASINADVTPTNVGNIIADITHPTNGLFVTEFKDQLKVGDTVNYLVIVYHNRLGYRKDNLSWQVAQSDLQDAYSPFGPTCKTASTSINGGQTTCIGELIILDEFDGPSVNTTKWTVEQGIPTYEGMNLELNSYENRDDTRHFKDGVLLLKPIALDKDSDVRGTLDLRTGCTAKKESQCYYQYRGGQILLPPVKSAKITSKIPFKYGKVEIKAKLPAGDWIIPVIELELKDKSELSPKILIAYSRGNDHLTGIGGDDIGSRLLYGGPVFPSEETEHREKLKTRLGKNDMPFSSDYHIYTLEWLPGKMTFYVDAQPYGTIDTSQGFPEFGSDSPDAPFNKECLLSLGVAVGGVNDFPDNYISGDKVRPWNYANPNYVWTFFEARNVWSATWKGDNSALRVEYVKVWAV